MSDSDGDFSDELLELAGAGEKKRKRGQHKSGGKRRKPDSHLASSDNEYESEDDHANPYPLEGKYKDEEDRLQLLQLSEIERENILAQRLEEFQRIQDKRNLDIMLRAQSQSQRGGDADAVSKAAKRAHAQRGATKEKSRKLDELKEKRKAKDQKKRIKLSSPKRDRSSSPMDMEMSDDEEEDGQISKFEQEEEREQRLVGKGKTEEETATLDDLTSCQLTRDLLCRYSKHPWFEDYAKGAWVRYLIGDRNGTLIYRMCEIVNIDPNLTRPYKIDNNLYDQQLELKVGKSVKTFPFDKVSNGRFVQKEFDWLLGQCQSEQVKLPTKRALEKKHEQIQRLPKQVLTNKDIDAMLAKKQSLQAPVLSSLNLTLQKQRTAQAHRFALMRGDAAEVAELEQKLTQIEEVIASSSNGVNDVETTQDVLAMVNERNRKANLEAVRRAEVETAEKKKKERKARFLEHQGKRAGGVNTPKSGGTPLLGASSTPARSVSPMPLPGAAMSSTAKRPIFEALMVASIEVDLGDF